MQQEKHSLIAFNDLKRVIIDPGFCTLCGACEAACPIHTIKIEDKKPKRLHDCSENLDSCPICYDICPHTETLMFEMLRFVADANHRRESLGYYREILLAQATSPDFRVAGKSGGVINALLNFALSEKMIDGAIVSEASSKVPVKVRPLISLVPDDMLSAVDCKLVPSAVAEAFGRAVFEHGKIRLAFVGVPCHVLALRKLEAWQHKLMDSLEITIGLFCLWTFSLDKLLEYLLHEHGVAANEIQSVDLTANEYLVFTQEGVVKIPISEVKEHIMNRCRTCTDFTSEFADLSIGGATPLKEWSIIIVRTKKGEDLIKKAVEKGVIIVKEIMSEPETLAHLIQLSMHKRNSALREMKEMRERGVPIPGAAEISTKPTPSEISTLEEVRVEEVMTKDVLTLSPSVTVAEFLEEIAKHHHIGFPIKDEMGKVLGIVTLQDAMKVPKEKRSSTTIEAICSKDLLTIFPENSVAEAFEKMTKNNVGRLLVVDRRDRLLLRGIITRSDIMHAIRKNR